MYRQTLAQIKILSILLPDPIRAEWAMCNFLYCSVKLCKRVLTRNLLSVLRKRGLGTNKVENCVSKLAKDSNKKNRDVEMIRFIMKKKLQDAEYEEKIVRKEFGRWKTEYGRVVHNRCDVDLAFKCIMQKETNDTWVIGNKKNCKKIDTLTNKYKKKSNAESRIRYIAYRDSDLENLRRDGEQPINEPRLYGGAKLTTNQTNLLKKDPTFMVLSNIDMIEMEVEIEKGVTKARYELMSRENSNLGEDANGESDSNHGDSTNAAFNYASIKATDLPTLQRIYAPKHANIDKEKAIDNIKEKLLRTASEYKNMYCDSKGTIKNNNLNKMENQAIREIKKDIKEGKIIVSTTDKSGRFSIDTPNSYEEAIKEHTKNDLEIDNNRVKQCETRCNQHMRILNKIFKVGSNHNQEDRITGATNSTNTPAPPMYGLRKDHKESAPVRPVCNGSQSPNNPLSHFMSRVVNDYADAANIGTECRSSQEMRAEFEIFNKNEPMTRKKCCVLSMDVNALYPSMEWDEIINAVRELIEESEEEVESVDWNTMARYLAVCMSSEEIEEEKLQHVIPKRKKETGRDITVAYLCNKSNEDKWLNARMPGTNQKKKMIALTVTEGIKACMSNHVYSVGDKQYMQLRGGPIGLELTGAVSRAVMWRWDKMYLKRVKKAGIKMLLYERYVDDSNQVAMTQPPGARYHKDTQKIVIDREQKEIDLQIPEDERLGKILLEIANSIVPCIQMKGDWPTKNEDQKLPILDMKVWINSDGYLVYQHYEKPVCSKTVLNDKSAHARACKRSVHTQEILRRLLNSSHRLNWEKETATVVTEYMSRMRTAGYGENYRKEVLKHAIGIYDKKWEDDMNGVQPIFRPKNWKREERKEAKRRKRHEWATKGGHIAPIFVPATPGGTLMKMMRKVAEDEAKEGIRFKIIEMGGRTLKSMFQKSNPTATQGCSEEDCIGCNIERGKGGNCQRNNINYEIECQVCPEGRKAIYIGETSNNLYTRTKQHIGRKNHEDSFINKHTEEYHQGEEVRMEARVTHTNKDCLTRQIREGILIRRCTKPVLNSKSEWFQPPIFQLHNEIMRN